MGKYVKVEYYAEWDDITGSYGVFDTETGKCYSNWGSKEKAEEEAEIKNQGSGLLYIS
jgi:hypothetical protein